MSDTRSATENSTVSFWTRTILYVGTWAAALLAIDLRLWPIIYLFPAGLFAFLPPGEPDEKWATPLLCLGWLVYIVHAIFFFRANRRRVFWILYIVLALLFIGNVGGCHQMLRGTPYGH